MRRDGGVRDDIVQSGNISEYKTTTEVTVMTEVIRVTGGTEVTEYGRTRQDDN